MKYIVCEKCKKVFEYNPQIKHEGGTTYTTITCSKCGYTKTTNTSHIHYGEDGKP